MSWRGDDANEGGISIEPRVDAGTPTEQSDREAMENRVLPRILLRDVIANHTDLYEVD